MRCDRAKPQLSAYLDDALAEPHRRAVRGHLLTCGTCRGVADELKTLQRQLRAVPDPEVPDRLFARIESTMAAQDVALSATAPWTRTIRAWFGAWRSTRAARVGVPMGLAAGAAVALAALTTPTNRPPRHVAGVATSSELDGRSQIAPRADANDMVDVAARVDREAERAYAEAIAEVRGELGTLVRIDDPRAQAQWRAVQAELARYEQRLAGTADPATRRTLLAEAAAFAGDALAMHHTETLVARSQW